MSAAHIEVLDRTQAVQELFAQSVQDHPAVANDPDLMAKAEQAQAALADIYQAIGRKSWGPA